MGVIGCLVVSRSVVMWWAGTLLLLVAINTASAGTSVDVKDVKEALRLKRSPQYCPPYYPPPPPPPPPPFWPPPPPPPPYWPHRHRHFDDYNDGAEAQAVAQASAKSQAQSGALTQAQGGNKPCETCNQNNQNSAVSNANSDSGDAVAIAIARAHAPST